MKDLRVYSLYLFNKGRENKKAKIVKVRKKEKTEGGKTCIN